MSDAPPPPRRSAALDALRGLGVAGMVLVNNPGSWGHIYRPLAHAEWHGCSAADIVFPLFLFAMGAALALAPPPAPARALRRVATLFLLGLLLNGFPGYEHGRLRVMGVLQRIALCYMLALPLVRRRSPVVLLVAVVALLAGYAALLLGVPEPGLEAPALTAEHSISSWLDRELLGARHLWRGGPHDPEGIPSTLGALATTLAGALAATALCASSPRRAAVALGAAGSGAVAVGLAASRSLPLNKSLWTSSYALHTAGIAALLLALLVLLDGSPWRRLLFPLEVFGRNALLLFVGSGLLARVVGLLFVDVAGKRTNVKTLLYERLLVPVAGPEGGSLLYGLLFLALFWVALLPLHRRHWFWTA